MGSKIRCQNTIFVSNNLSFVFLRVQMSSLKKNAVILGPGSKIEQKILPGGYSDFGVSELKWHSLHMAAAGLCRAIAYMESKESFISLYQRPLPLSDTFDEI